MAYAGEKTRGAVLVEQIMIALAFMAGSALLMAGWLWGARSVGTRATTYMFVLACALGIGAIYVVVSAIKDFVNWDRDQV